MSVALPSHPIDAQIIVRANSGGATASAIRSELTALSWVTWRLWAEPLPNPPPFYGAPQSYRVFARTYPVWSPIAQVIPAVCLDGNTTWDAGHAETLAETCATEQAIVIATADSGYGSLTEINLATAATVFAGGADFVAICGCSYADTYEANKVGSGSPYEVPADDPYNLFHDISDPTANGIFDPYSLAVRADYAGATLKLYAVPKP